MRTGEEPLSHDTSNVNAGVQDAALRPQQGRNSCMASTLAYTENKKHDHFSCCDVVRPSPLPPSLPPLHHDAEVAIF